MMLTGDVLWGSRERRIVGLYSAPRAFTLTTHEPWGSREAHDHSRPATPKAPFLGVSF